MFFESVLVFFCAITQKDKTHAANRNIFFIGNGLTDDLKKKRERSSKNLMNGPKELSRELVLL